MRFFTVSCVTEDYLAPIFDQEAVYQQLGKTAGVWFSRNTHNYTSFDERKDFCAHVAIFRDLNHADDQALRAVEGALSYYGINADIEKVEECTFDAFQGLGWRDSPEFSTFRLLNLVELNELRRAHNSVGEEMIDEGATCADMLERSVDSEYHSDLSVEVARIFDYEGVQASRSQASFIPVHYLIEGANSASVEPALDVLLASLYACGRFPARRSYHINVDRLNEDSGRMHDGRAEAFINDALGHALSGGALVIRYGIFDDGSNFNEYSYRVFILLLDQLAAHINDIQAVFVVPPHRPQVRQQIERRLGRPLVVLSPDEKASRCEDFASTLESAREIAEKVGIVADDHFEEALRSRMEDQSFTDIEEFVDSYRCDSLTQACYSGYLPELQEWRTRVENGRGGISAQERLDSLIGLADAKHQIARTIKRWRMNKQAERAGLPVQPFSLHAVFAGSPGTGKTEVAKLYAEILNEQGVLREGRVVMCAGSANVDFSKVFDSAIGSVLFIDEAYGLLSRPGVITELIAFMENHREDTVVILAGYVGHMDVLLDSNPGFRSRLGCIVYFPDYSPEELQEIFHLMCCNAALELSEEADEYLSDVFARAGKRGDQGNARFVRNLFEEAIGNQQERLAEVHQDGSVLSVEELGALLLEDVQGSGIEVSATTEDPREELFNLIGLEDVKHEIVQRIMFHEAQRARRRAGVTTPFMPMHMVFAGNPGTGKTEVARLVGRILAQEKVLSVGDFYECGMQDLTAHTVSGTTAKIENLFQQARGSVIFIDEAYNLLNLPGEIGGNLVITSLIDQMEKYREEVVVILAGYTQEMEFLMEVNPGFSSRISCTIEFRNYDAEELVAIFEHMACKRGLTCEEGVLSKVRDVVDHANRGKQFGNARFVRQLLDDTMLHQAMRLNREYGTLEGLGVDVLTTLVPEDIVWEEPAGTSFGFC